MNNKHLLAISAPSGGGKSTFTRHIMSLFPNMKFSVSATTRQPRISEKDGIDYYFLEKENFEKKIENNEFAEWELIFGNYYGTLKSEIEKAKQQNTILIFDIDVKGALSLKKLYQDEILLIFIMPPDMDVLEQRLRNRATESNEQILSRLERANSEIYLSKEFDIIILNNILEIALNETVSILKEHFEMR